MTAAASVPGRVLRGVSRGVLRRTLRRMSAALVVLQLASCAGGPPPPDWQLDARAAMDRAVAAYLSGDSRLEAREFELARGAVARTGRVDLLARAELMRCAARAASLVFEPCDGFEKLRVDAGAPERAYADFLSGRLQPRQAASLPPEQRAAAAAPAGEVPAAVLQEIKDPFARLVAAAVLFQSSRASPQAISLAVDTASSQGWRRPLLAWLHVQLRLAERAGDAAEAGRLQRRIELAQ
jgi:hypothetical protein